MEWAKVPLEKMFGFIGALIPGTAGLLIFLFHRPDLVNGLWNAAHIGYQTKLATLLLCMFAMGWTLASAFVIVMGGLGGAIGGFVGQHEPSTKPWYDPNWRSLVSKFLGDAAPDNLEQVLDQVFNAELQSAERFPEPERSQRVNAAYMKKTAAMINELQWKSWWAHFRFVSIAKESPTAVMAVTLAHDFQAASLLLLASLPFTPPLRHWWLVAPCIFWVVELVLESIMDFVNLSKPWASMSQQMEFLQSQVSKGQHFGANAD